MCQLYTCIFQDEASPANRICTNEAIIYALHSPVAVSWYCTVSHDSWSHLGCIIDFNIGPRKNTGDCAAAAESGVAVTGTLGTRGQPMRH